MNGVSILLACVASLLVIAFLGVVFRKGSSLIYACRLIVCTLIFVTAGGELLAFFRCPPL